MTERMTDSDAVSNHPKRRPANAPPPCTAHEDRIREYMRRASRGRTLWGGDPAPRVSKSCEFGQALRAHGSDRGGNGDA